MANSASVSCSIGFIGAGAMAEALASGWIQKKVIESGKLLACDPSEARREVFSNMNASVFESAVQMCKETVDVIFVATKPQYVESVLKDCSQHLKNALVVSIAAGKTIDSLESALRPHVSAPRVIRVMPNTPCMVGESAAAMCRGSSATDKDCAIVKTLMEAVGVIEEVPETMISAVTGLSGSGPAYVYLIIEAMADAGVKAGLPRSTALKLAAQTLVGGGKMVLENGHPGVLKDLVTSPGGTTIAGVHAMECAGVRGAMMQAVGAAVARADELSKL